MEQVAQDHDGVSTRRTTVINDYRLTTRDKWQKSRTTLYFLSLSCCRRQFSLPQRPNARAITPFESVATQPNREGTGAAYRSQQDDQGSAENTARCSQHPVMFPPFLKAGTNDAGNAGFAVSSSLPPMVTGALAGEMELSVPYLSAKPGALRPTRDLRHRQYSDPLCAARIQWWGEGGPGTVLKPDLLGVRDEKGEMARRAVLSNATCALFPVRCGLDGLVAYLKDMVSWLNIHAQRRLGQQEEGICLSLRTCVYYSAL